MATHSHETLLKAAGLRVTAGRLAILGALEKESKPVTVEQLGKRLKGALNSVTLYRALEALKDARIVARVGLGHEHAHYELVHGRPHHHHVVCTSCGHIEDIEVPHSRTPEQDAHKRAKTFTSIESYALEFFGTCRTCA